jgi:hypothetical protein
MIQKGMVRPTGLPLRCATLPIRLYRPFLAALLIEPIFLAPEAGCSQFRQAHATITKPFNVLYINTLQEFNNMNNQGQDYAIS